MARIPEDVIERVKAAHDIVELVGRSVPLKKAGRTWKALCPFHEEKTPSFTVNPERQTFKCFGCQKGGNVFQWLEEREGLKFFEAVRALAAEKGIVVPSSGGRDAGPEPSRIEPIRAVLALAQDLYVRTLAGPEGAETRTYLAHRGFPEPAVRELGLGLSPASWDILLRLAASKGLSASTVEEAGFAVPRESGNGHYDRFRGRLMFPVADVSGRIVTYGARALHPDDTPKYLNGPETAVFKKGRMLYGLDRAKDAIRKAGYGILMEGYTDVLMAHMHGFTGAVAGMGTAFTPEQAKALGRYAPRVVLLYDGDAAGRLAAEKSIDTLLDEGLEVRVALLPEGKDVDEVLLEEGVERLQAVIDGALDLFDFKIDQLAKTTDLSTPRGKATAAERLGDSIRRVRDVIERDQLFVRVAERLGVPENLVRVRAGQSADEERRHRRPASGSSLGGSSQGLGSTTGGGDAGGRVRSYDLRLEQERLVAGALFRPELLRSVRDVLPPAEIEEPGLRTLYGALLAMADAGLTATVEALARTLSADPVAGATLAGLPEELAFDDWIPDAVRIRQAALDRDKRRQAVLQLLAGSAPSPIDRSPDGPSGAR